MKVTTIGSKKQDIFFEKDVFNLKEHPDSKVQKLFKKCHNNTVSYDLSGIKYSSVKEDIKSFFKCLLNRTDLKFNSMNDSYLLPLKYLIDFVSSHAVDCLYPLEPGTRKLYIDFLTNKKANILHKRKTGTSEGFNITIIDKLSLFVRNFHDKRTGFDRDVWHLKDYNLSESRIDKSKSNRSIDFTILTNVANRELVKLYLKYLLTNTKKSIATIGGIWSDISSFITYLDNKNLSDIKRDDIEKYYETLNAKNIKNKTFNRYIYSNYFFLRYCELNEKIKQNHFYLQDIKPAKIEFKLRAIDDYVMDQIFNCIDKLPLHLSCMFLLMYSTGMRVSEVCIIKKDAVYDAEGYYIKFYSQKMKKEVTNPIPISLFELLCEQREIVNKQYSENETYLFPIKPNTPIKTYTFQKHFKNFCFNNKIKNTDGSLYIFRCHDLRHTLGQTMVKCNIPIDIIQKILHHASQEMTLAYTFVNDNRRIDKYKSFINIKGEEMALLDEDNNIILDDLAKIGWIKANIQAQILPNGICALPVVLQKCPHGNACLVCSYFCTSIDFLDIHKQQLKKTEEYLVLARKNNWKRQIETNKEVMENLKIIIDRLEN